MAARSGIFVPDVLEANRLGAINGVGVQKAMGRNVKNYDAAMYIADRIPFWNQSRRNGEPTFFGCWCAPYGPEHWFPADHIEGNDWYVVYSYRLSWPLVAWSRTAQMWFVNEDKYSRTTTLHLLHARRGVGHSTPTQVVSCNVLVDMVAAPFAKAVAQRMMGR